MHTVKKQVHFAPLSETLHYLACRPVCQTKQPLERLCLEPLNCRDRLYTTSWLADVSEMKKDPYCRLDYVMDTIEWPAQTDSQKSSPESYNDPPPPASSRLVGEVAVYNLHFSKRVFILYTLDRWKTSDCVQAVFWSSIGTLRIDKFGFFIDVPDGADADRELELAIRYEVLERCFWDNNNEANYRFKCHKAALELELGLADGEKPLIGDDTLVRISNQHLPFYTNRASTKVRSFGQEARTPTGEEALDPIKVILDSALGQCPKAFIEERGRLFSCMPFSHSPSRTSRASLEWSL